MTFVRALQVIVTADTNRVIATDSLSFKAALTDSAELTPVGWRWQPLVDTLWDPWTKACSGTPSTCKIQVHGSGTMFFKATRQNGDSVVGSLAVVAELPPAAEDEGDPEFLEDEEIITANLLGAKTLDFLEPITVGPEISVQQGEYIASAAVASGEWTYTQGCAQCYHKVMVDDTTTATIGDSIWVRVHGPYNEPAWDPAHRVGDCTDFTLAAIKSVLGGAFPHPKISTRMFNHWVADSAAAADSLLKYGYTQVAAPRAGDVVVKAKTGPTPQDSKRGWNGHAGIFLGWAAPDSLTGARAPIGWANNGKPAGWVLNDTNEDRHTEWRNFAAPEGFITKFFRPHTSP